MERYERQSGMVSLNQLNNEGPVAVIGCGAGGRSTAITLGTMGVKNLLLFDHDVVEEVNLGAQGFAPDDIGLSKVEVVKRELEHRTEANVYAFARRWTVQDQARVVFCCVDTMSARTFIFQHLRDCRFWSDGRQRAWNLRLLTAYDIATREYYRNTLITDDQADPGRCTARMSYCAALVGTGIAVSQYTVWCCGAKPAPDLLINLFADSYEVNGPAWRDSSEFSETANELIETGA